ncbi:hypothetical protein POTOM_012965 [Populus tomentosa]|uniref:Reverse transcriptase domain-containing protein n=1 Tax=Populus tomentosa TaxID=118781 RepID=A0A8X7ZZU8_POPTO|nr:hypothetical protein POTOM_012965 [Populus tomentosa]
MLMENSYQWSRCMVGFFPGYKMPYHAVNKIASRVWKQCGLEHVTTTANGFMIFRFNTEENMHSVLEKGPWMFGGKNIILQQWHPRFQFDKNKISTLPVWIRLHGLPFPLWSKQGLSLAASMIGRPLSCDEQTYNCTRLEYARVCVEIDAALPYVQNFEIDSPLSAEPITVTVDYEWKPSRCEKCHVFGHSCLSIAATQPASMDKGKGITEFASQANTNPSFPIPQDPLTSADPSSSNVPLPTIPCITTHIAITTTTDPPSPSLPSSPTAHCPPPSLDPQPIPNTIPIPSPANPSPITLPAVPHAQPDLHIPGNEANTFHPTMPHVVLDTAPCQESKMASLSTTSESSQIATTATTETFSNFIANDDASPMGQTNTIPCPTISKEPHFKVRDADTPTVAANPVADSTSPATSPFAPNFLKGVQAPSAFTPIDISLAASLLAHDTQVGSDDDRLHLLPSTSNVVLQGIHGEEEYGSDHSSEADPLRVEECQHLITGFPSCVESKMVAFTSCSEASSTAKECSFDTSSIQTVKHFQSLLTSTAPHPEEDPSMLFANPIPTSLIPDLILPVTNEEIKAALFSIPDNKAPGPDGFTSLFFKRCWDIIGAEFLAAIKYFFDHTTLPRCVNATRIALVPKVENPTCMDDYRPISCCNVMYKCISKIMVARLKTILPEVIGPSQSAFVPGRQISDNILLTQELMHNYHLNRGPARCALKVDLRKAFDTISWPYILMGLKAIGIPDPPPTQENDQAQNPPIQSPTPLPQQGTLIVHTHTALPPSSLAVTIPKAGPELATTTLQPKTTKPPTNTSHQNSSIQLTANHTIIPHTNNQTPHDLPLIPPKTALLQSQKVARASATGNHIIAQDSGNVLPAPSYLSGSNPVPCIESKMDSFRSLSASSSAAKEEYAETSTTSISSPEHHDISPPPSPKTVRKKKGGKKRKEARGL